MSFSLGVKALPVTLRSANHVEVEEKEESARVNAESKKKKKKKKKVRVGSPFVESSSGNR